MKIAIILCPSLVKRCPLIGLGYLSSYLEERGHQVTIFDLNAEMDISDDYDEVNWRDKRFVEGFISNNEGLFESFSERILQSGADIIGFSVWATTSYVSMALARMIKEKDRDRLVVCGGPESSFGFGSLIHNDAVDVVVYGEGEKTFSEIIELYERRGKLSFCPGCLLKMDNEIIDCGYNTEIENLDSLPFPDYSKFPLLKYCNPNFISMAFYRGCLRHCAFCNTAVTWRRFRSRTADSIYKEMVYQIKKFPDLEKFEIDDTALNLNLPMLSELCDLMLYNRLKIKWGGSALIRKEMSSELIKKMAKAGCDSLGYGLESGSQKIVDAMGKGFKIKDAERIIRDTYDAGIETVLGIIIGFPGETDREFQETLDFIERNKGFISKVNFPSECCFVTGSYMQLHPERFNVVLDPSGDGELWRSKDGKNTHEVRLRRKDIFNNFLDSLGTASGNYATAHG